MSTTRPLGAAFPPRLASPRSARASLLGLLREEEGIAAAVLRGQGITVERVREQIERIIGRGEEVTPGAIPFTPRAKKVLEFALAESGTLGHSHIGTEHMLLGLARVNDGVADRILSDFDVQSAEIRNEVTRLLSGPHAVAESDRPQAPGARVPPGAPGSSREPDPADPGPPIQVRLDGLLLGDLGNPRVDARLLSAMLLRDGKVAEWLRSRGVDAAAVEQDFPGSGWD